MTNYQQATLRLECLRLAKEIHINPASPDFDKNEGIVYQGATLQYKLADEIYNYCINQCQTKEMD